jgi:CubicO group peptidase (beta-lactamase class C family)
VRKIIHAKYWAGLSENQPISTQNLYEDLNTTRYEMVYRQLVANSLTLVKNTGQLIPYTNLDQKKMACVSIGGKGTNYFQKKLKSYSDVAFFDLPDSPTPDQISEVIRKIEPFSEIIVSFQSFSESPTKRFGITKEAQNALKKIAEVRSTTLVSFTNPYALNFVNETSLCNAVVVAYNNKVTTQEMAAQLLFGGIGAAGKLPVSAGEFNSGSGYETKAIRFSYGLPEEVGFDMSILGYIDSIALQTIADGATPGCQILIAKDQKIVWNKSYGYHTYAKKKAVESDDIYDLASLTKVIATLPGIMQLDDRGVIDLDGTLGLYLPEIVGGTEYAKITLREMLAHQSGLKAWIPFYLKTMENGVPRYDVYSLVQNTMYPHRVATDLYAQKDFPDSVMRIIVNTKLNPQGEYLYSDLGYYFLQAIIEKYTAQSLDSFAMERFYAPLGMSTTGYLPRNRFPLERIVPTENDTYFRKQLIHGDVHDPGSAMMGGVGGHAGVFSDAEDLAKIWQMYLNYGTYGGTRFIDSATVSEYTKCQYCLPDDKGNRRGAGFDKPIRYEGNGPTCNCVSYTSFGHTGFTGTISWADPEENLIYIFLSNRIHPSAENKKLITNGVRSQIQEVIYDALIR